MTWWTRKLSALKRLFHLLAQDVRVLGNRLLVLAEFFRIRLADLSLALDLLLHADEPVDLFEIFFQCQAFFAQVRRP